MSLFILSFFFVFKICLFINAHPETKHRTIYSKSDGLPSDLVYSTLGSAEHLWLATHSGLCQFSPSDKKMNTYYKEQGLPYNEFNRWSYLQAKTGRLYFGGLNGVIGFDPEKFLLEEEKRGFLNLVAISKYNQKEETQKNIPNLPYAGLEQVVVSPFERNILFKYALSRYESVRKNQYYHYMMYLKTV